MNKQQRDSIFGLALLPDEMNVQLIKAVNFNASVVLRDLVESLFRLSPIPFLPCFRQSLHVSEGNPEIPR